MTIDEAVGAAVARAVDDAIGPILKAADANRAAGDRLLIPEAEAARICGVSAAMLKDLRAAGKIRPHRRSRPILYARDQLEEIVRLLAD